MITLKSNKLEGQYAAPMRHPPTCANPTPWLITKMRIDSCHDCLFAIWIRGEESMWFLANQCHIGELEELKEWVENKYPSKEKTNG